MRFSQAEASNKVSLVGFHWRICLSAVLLVLPSMTVAMEVAYYNAGPFNSPAYIIPAYINGVINISASGSANNTAVLKSDGTVLVWGDNTYQQCQAPSGLSGVVSVSMGGGQVLALKNDGSVVAWGQNIAGQATVPANTLAGVTAIAAGGQFSLALKGGVVVAWGTQLSGISGVSADAVAAGDKHALTLKNGIVNAWGNNGSGQCNVPNGLTNVIAVAAGFNHSVALKNNGTIVTWGDNSYNELTIPAGLSNVTAIAAGNGLTVALKNNGTVVAWGNNTVRQSTVPTGLAGVTAIAAGADHSVTLKNDGTIVAWGITGGESIAISTGIAEILLSLGNGAILTSSGTVQLVGGGGFDFAAEGWTGITSVATSVYNILGLKNDGTILSAFSFASSNNIPVGLAGVQAIALGGQDSALALKSDGTVAAWGDNTGGQLTLPPNLNNVVAVSCGYYHDLALKNDGTVVVWGDNTSGQCNVPAGLSGVIAISGGQLHSLALKSDGTVVAWGDNSQNQSTVPPGLNGVIAIAAGFDHSVALKNDGTVISWGFGGTNSAIIPGASAIGAGNQETGVLIGVLGPLITNVSPSSGPTAGGTTVTITGNNLSFASQVTFGGIPASIVSNTASQVVATTPAHASGIVDVSVTAPGGTAANSGGFTYADVPTITFVSPGSGPAAGGTTVTITGTNLIGGTTSATFGGIAATVVSNTPTQLVVTSPAHAAGAADVAVTTTGGGTATDTGAFNYLALPTITSITPNTGTVNGGTPVTIAGTNLAGATSVTFGGTAATINSNTNTTLMVTTPAHVSGVVDVVVTATAGIVTSTGGYTFTPIITSVSPATGPAMTGTPVTITGVALTGATSVTFGGVAATSVNVVSGTQITCTTPATLPAGAVNVTVVTTPGNTVTSTNAYTFGSAPVVISVSPPSGLPAGGNTVTINGTNLTGATPVTFGGTAATNIVVVSSTQITCKAPAHAAGAVNVAVTTPNGTGTLTNGYLYAAVPTVTSLNVNSGLPAGGTSVTITGTNLLNATSVTFGGVAATNVTVVNATQITCTTPSHAAGVVNVVVTTPSGAATLTDGFTYLPPPTITNISPSSGPPAGGTSVTITGTNLTGTSSVTFGGVVATNVTVVSATQVTCTAPAGAVGAADVDLTALSGPAGSPGGFTYVGVPTISSPVSPAAGPLAGGTTVTITGTNLLGTTSVTFGGAGGSITSATATTIVVITPSTAAAGAVDIVVTAPGGQVTSTGAFTYSATAPNITSIIPASGNAGTQVTITGTNLAGATSVTFGGVAAAITSDIATQIDVTAPSHSVGPVNVSVTTINGIFTITSGFVYIVSSPPPAPTITSVMPASGPVAGGTPVTIVGTNLGSATSVTFGGVTATINTNIATQITVLTPPNTAGFVNVIVTTAGGVATSTNSFTYIPAPTITSVMPASGPVSGGTSVTIAGTNLGSATSVTFGGVTATINTNSTTQITATTPANTAGTVNVSVTAPGGIVTSTGSFTYIVIGVPAPTITSVLPASGPVAGGTSVTIAGTNLGSATSVTFGGVAATINTNSATQITATTPANTAGTVNVSVTAPGGIVTSTGSFTYIVIGVPAPTITSVSPASGPATGGTSVMIVGTNLTGASSVTFGGMAGTITSNTATQIGVTTPANAVGPADVTVTTPGGITTSTGAFSFAGQVASAPTITSISPMSGPIAGGTMVTISGTNLLGVVTVTFGGIQATVFSFTDTQLVVMTPTSTVGVVDVIVTTSNGTVTAPGAFTFISAALPLQPLTITKKNLIEKATTGSVKFTGSFVLPAGTTTLVGPFTCEVGSVLNTVTLNSIGSGRTAGLTVKVKANEKKKTLTSLQVSFQVTLNGNFLAALTAAGYTVGANGAFVLSIEIVYAGATYQTDVTFNVKSTKSGMTAK